MTKHKIGLFGYGCVGQGFTELLNKKGSLNAEIAKVCVKHPDKNRPGIPGNLALDPKEILDDTSIDTVVELIDDADAAFDIVSQALQKDKNVVSANKKMIAENLEQLNKLQQKSKGKLLYEGAVCGSIPVLSSIRNYYQQDGVHTISGIFNGSTNYILTKVIDEKLSYDQALEEAKINGFAETDPLLDVGGYDPRFKLSILIHQIFKTYVNPEDILRIGIQQISSADVRFARENGLKIKLIAKASRVEDKIQAWVAPQFVEADNSFSGIDYEYNAVKVTSDAFGEQLLTGKGAGKLPTGLAVLADVAAIVENSVASSKELNEEINLDNDQAVEVYIGYKPYTSIDWSYFESVKEKLIGKADCHAIGRITLGNLIQLTQKDPTLSIIFTSGVNIENNLTRLTYSNVSTVVEAL